MFDLVVLDRLLTVIVVVEDMVAIDDTIVDDAITTIVDDAMTTIVDEKIDGGEVVAKRGISITGVVPIMEHM